MKKIAIVAVSVSAVVLCAGYLCVREWKARQSVRGSGADDTWPDCGQQVGSFEGVVIYSNGAEVYKSHGKNFAEDGYYYGHQWQCVEFVKRYYYETRKHRMPNVWGHAKSYFKDELAHRELNAERGMIQYANGGDEAPMPGDLIVWNKGPYGHVAIVSKVGADSIEVAQQNIKGKPFETIQMTMNSGAYQVGGETGPAGWLRIP